MKRALAIILSAVMLVSTLAAVVSAGDFYLYQNFLDDATYSMGDVNNDDTVNAIDSMFMKQLMVGSEEKNVVQDAADFDSNGKVTSSDSYCLKLCLAGVKKLNEFENKKQTNRMTIGGIDISNFSIVLPETSTTEQNIYLAYLNFMKYIRRVTGVEIPMTKGTSNTDNTVYFYDVSMDTELGQHLGYEGYKYEVKDGDLHIYGTYRGNMYAVADILEEYLGIRFYSSSETFVYKQRYVDIPEGTCVEKIPTVNYRYARHTFGRNPEYHFFPNKLNGSQLNGYDEPFWGTKTGPLYSNAHSFLEYWQMGTGTMPDESYGNLSNRYQAKYDSGVVQDPYDWQPCATKETDYQTLFQGMLDCNRMVMSWGRYTYIEEGLTVFSFSIADNQAYCTCRNCTKISKDEGYAGLYLKLYNRATEDAQAYYPGVRLYGIVYAKDFPKTIKPHKNFIILYCGIGCNNHILGQEECYERGGQLNNISNAGDLKALPFWGKLCEETGAELWFWIYPVTYHYYLIGCPNVFNLYHNMKWLYEEANVTGFFYEGGGTTYNFETLKEYTSVKFMWDPEMTFEEWQEIAKEYLYINYGYGYEELYKYIEMQTEAGDRCGTCFINNYDRPGDMYSYDYIAENYDEMRGLLETAYAKADTDARRARIETLLVSCDFLALSSLHTEWYIEGNNVEIYKERYDWMYNYIKSHNMRVFSSSVYTLPETIDYEINPMIQFYEFGSRRIGVMP